MRHALAVLACFLLLGPVAADERKADPPKPLTPEQAAGAVLEAVRAKDEKALKSLAEKDKPDPWLVADELCYRGEHDAATTFAKEAPRNAINALLGYVESQRNKPFNSAGREAITAAKMALREKDPRAALASIDAADTTSDDVVSVTLLQIRGHVLRSLRRLEESTTAFLAAANAAERLGWLTSAAAGFHHSAMNEYRRSDWRRALAAWEHRLAIEELRGNRAGMAATLTNIGILHGNLGYHTEALAAQERALAINEEMGRRAGVVAVLGSIGLIHQRLGNYTKALACQERSLVIASELDDRVGVARALGNIGNIYWDLGSYEKALEVQERALAIGKELGNQAHVATILGNIGGIHQVLGSYGKALEFQGRALAMKEELGDRAGAARTLGNIGVIHQKLGAYAKAFACQERTLALMEKLGDRAGVAGTLVNIGNMHWLLGAYAKAFEVQDRALTLLEDLGERARVAEALANIGLIHGALGDHEEALEIAERALALTEELEKAAGVATTLANIGTIHGRLGNHTKSLEVQERALAMKRDLEDRPGTARSLGAIGSIHYRLGAHAKALGYQERALALASDLGLLEVEVWMQGSLAMTHLALEKPGEAVRAARVAVEKLPLLVGGLADEQGATARDQYAGILDGGAAAAVQLEDVTAVSFFLESGRAGALLESLGGRSALVEAVIPEGLRKEETRARAGVLAAQRQLGRAQKAGKRKEMRAARSALDGAHSKVLEAVARIQRAAKAGADIVYPRAAPLAEIQATLEAGDALVTYSTLREQTVALVVTPREARTVRLAKLEVTPDLGDVETPWEDAVARLRKAVLEPLGLGKETKRLLISPSDTLSYVPFGVLAPQREVVYVPSGTTYTVLSVERSKRGSEVLALGAPEYGVKRDASAGAMFGGGRTLSPLPATRREVKAVGDHVLLGERATETTLASVVTGRERWRAVHLACHGLVDPERPMLSALALTADEANDGFMTALEIFRMNIPADLVVMSACETGKGKIYKTEGIVGLTRAFMFAGAPRVICSLWNVDDEATQALMIKFYELWDPKEGKGLSAAAALKKAQEYIRSHEKWEHPYYWAAWALWGLPD